MVWEASSYGGGHWTAAPQVIPVIQARAVAALSFLSGVTGPDSEWARRATRVYESNGNSQSVESGARAVGVLLREWADQVEGGWAVPLRTAEASPRSIGSTDLMDHVRAFNADPDVLPAVGIVLAGAALEMALRGACESCAVDPPSKPSLTKWAEALRVAGVLSAQQMKDVTQVAGLRNAAAHGQFDELSRERAGLCEQQVNLLLAQLDDQVRSLDIG